MKHFYHFLMILFIFGFTNKLYSQSVPSYVPTSGLVGWWGFNGNAQDGSGNGNHGTVNGATLTMDRFGNQNGAYSFDGLDDYIGVPTLTNLIHNVQFLTINCNLNSISGGVIFGNWISNSSPSGPIGFFFGITSDNRISISTVGGLQIYSVDTFGFLRSNQWNNLILVYDGTQTENTNRIKIYINNINYPFNFSHTIPTNLGNQSNTTFFGARGANHAGLSIAGFYDGKLDDIGIWNRALTQQEITNLYNSQLPAQTSLCLPTITTNTPTSIGIDSVVIGGDILNDGGSSIVLRGICYSTTPNPNMGNPRTEEGSGIGSFTSTVRNLSPSTTYYARSYAKNSQGVVVYGNEVTFTTTPLAFGMTYAGGIIFDLDSSGQHGMVCAPSDQGGYLWGCFNVSIPGTSSSVGSGSTNTAIIVANCLERPIAASVCSDLVLNGYSDWFLPSIGELSLMLSRLHSQGIGGFGQGWYWSSTQHISDWSTVYYIPFAWGSVGDIRKDYDYLRVRAVRAF